MKDNRDFEGSSFFSPWKEVVLADDGDGDLAVAGVPHDGCGGGEGPEGGVVLVVQV